MKHDPTISGIAGCTHENYSLSCAEFEALLSRAGHRCEICGRKGVETSHGRLYIDHDPRVGGWAARGLLCPSCNTRLGSENHFSAAATAYLKQPWYVYVRSKRQEVVHRALPRVEKCLQAVVDQHAKLKQLEAETRAARLKLGELLSAARASDVKQKDISEQTGENRETLRRWEREYDRQQEKAAS